MKGDKLIRVSAASTVVGIGLVAAYVSYRHALEVVRAHGETGPTALLSPLTIDGLVFVASMVLLDAARRGDRAPGLARWALALGIGATVAVNVLHGIAHGPVGAVIAAWPAVTLVLVVELLMGMIRRGRQVAVPPGSRQHLLAEPVPAEVAVPGETPAPAGDRVPVEVLSAARERFAEVLAAGTVPSVRAIRRELKVGHPRAVRIRGALGE